MSLKNICKQCDQHHNTQYFHVHRNPPFPAGLGELTPFPFGDSGAQPPTVFRQCVEKIYYFLTLLYFIIAGIRMTRCLGLCLHGNQFLKNACIGIFVAGFASKQSGRCRAGDSGIRARTLRFSALMDPALPLHRVGLVRAVRVRMYVLHHRRV